MEDSKFLNAALDWYRFGFAVIPIGPGSKVTAVKWDSWLECLSEEKIIEYWSKHPDHEVGFIVGDDLIVFDADSEEAVKVIWQIEQALGSPPRLVNKTTRGEHHIFKLAEGAYAKSDSHNTELFPERIDVKTGRALVMLPPSTGKSIKRQAAEDAQELSEVDQESIDALFAHNERPAPRPQVPKLNSRPKEISTDENITKLNALLENIDPSCGREDWLKVIMAIFHETRGADEGFALADSWSSKGSNYKGAKDVLTTWRSLNTDVANPITMGTLCKMVDAAGGDWMKTLADLEPGFEILKEKTVVIQPGESTTAHTKPKNNPLARFSITGKSEGLEQEAMERVPLLGPVAVLGQSTIFYAPPNAGKTLITIKLLTESIETGRISPADVFYLNVDDDSKGLVEKLKIAEEYGFHMLAEGHEGFTAKAFLDELRNIIAGNQCRGVVIILDTIKKFVDLMNKSQCRDYNSTLGKFVIKGGTVIAFAHTNKNTRPDGSLIHAGTTDILEDFSCAYTIRETSEKGAREKIVMFEKLKGRGGVANTACYSYLNGQEISYNEMFLSVQEIDPDRIADLQQAEVIRSDADVIEAVISCINEGVNTKMLLAEAAAQRSGASKRSVLKLIEKYTGTDPKQHRWLFVRGERGKQIFQVHDGLQNQE